MAKSVQGKNSRRGTKWTMPKQRLASPHPTLGCSAPRKQHLLAQAACHREHQRVRNLERSETLAHDPGEALTPLGTGGETLGHGHHPTPHHQTEENIPGRRSPLLGGGARDEPDRLADKPPPPNQRHHHHGRVEDQSPAQPGRRFSLRGSFRLGHSARLSTGSQLVSPVFLTHPVVGGRFPGGCGCPQGQKLTARPCFPPRALIPVVGTRRNANPPPRISRPRDA